MIRIFKVRTKIIYFKNIYKFCDNGSIFIWFLAQTKIQTDRETIFKLSHYNSINNSIKTFSMKKKYGNRSTHSNVMAEQRLKKRFLIGTCKKCLTYNHNFWYPNEGYLHQKLIQESGHWIHFYVIYGPNKYSDGKIDKLLNVMCEQN